MEKGIAIVTGGDGDMGQIVTMACALSGYRTIMACRNLESALPVRDKLRKECAGAIIEAEECDLIDRQSVMRFVDSLRNRNERVDILVNNAGIMPKEFKRTTDGVEMTVAVNYLGAYMLTRLLVPLMHKGSRVVNTISLTYRFGKIRDDFFTGDPKHFSRIPYYANTKLALLLFTYELAERLRERGISVTAADPGIVSTKMIRFNMWFDPVTDMIYRPVIKKPMKGAQTAIMLALSGTVAAVTGKCFANCKQVKIAPKYKYNPLREKLWKKSEEILSETSELKELLKKSECSENQKTALK